MDLLLEPRAWLVVILVSILGLAGNLALYQLGKRGVDAVRARFPRIKPEQWQRIGSLYEERGSWVLLLSAVPVLGTMLTTAAGAFGVAQPAFIFWVTIAKLLRNWVLAVIAHEIYLYFTR